MSRSLEENTLWHFSSFLQQFEHAQRKETERDDTLLSNFLWFFRISALWCFLMHWDAACFPFSFSNAFELLEIIRATARARRPAALTSFCSGTCSSTCWTRSGPSRRWRGRCARAALLRFGRHGSAASGLTSRPALRSDHLDTMFSPHKMHIISPELVAKICMTSSVRNLRLNFGRNMKILR